MPDVDTLGQAAQLALADYIRGALHSALLHSDPASVLTTASNARDAIEITVKRTLADEMRHLNASSKQLPVELWCTIWELLSEADRITVSRVCSQWREISHSCPSLWKSLQFYTTCHSSLCRCPSCTGSVVDKSTNPPGWEINRYPEGSTDVSRALTALTRSRCLPLHISFDVVPFTPNPAVVNFLMEALLPHSGRLSSLTLRVCKPEDAADFLARFDTLPVLRVLKLDAVMDNRPDGAEMNTHPFVAREIGLPSLEEFHLHSPRLLWPDGIAAYCPLLRILTVHIDDLDDVMFILRSFPGLASLHMQLSSDAQVHGRDLRVQRDLRTLFCTTSVTDVEVSGLRGKESFWVADTFNPRTRPLHCFSLGFGRWPNYGMPWALVCELGDGMQLTALRTETRSELCGTDFAGRVRRIWEIPVTADVNLFRLSFWLPTKDPVALTIDAYEWMPLVSHFADWPRVESLTIAFSVDADLASVPYYYNRMQDIRFPLLRLVTISILSGSVQVTAKQVVAFLRNLRLSAPLEVLRLGARIQDYDPELFNSFSRRVIID